MGSFLASVRGELRESRVSIIFFAVRLTTDWCVLALGNEGAGRARTETRSGASCSKREISMDRAQSIQQDNVYSIEIYSYTEFSKINRSIQRQKVLGTVSSLCVCVCVCVCV